MLGARAAILLCFLPSLVNGLLTTGAKCLSGFEWTFSSIGQSPCDVTAELAAVCVGGQFDLAPLPPGYIYAGPTQANQNSCRCSSVYYSLMSACSYCQGRDFIRWSTYSTNCSTVFLTVYNENIPVGVKVPAYAYQDVSGADTFNITLAQSMRGTESSRPPSVSSTTSIPRSNSRSSTAASAVIQTSSSGSNAGTRTVNNTPAIVGGVVGGLVAIGLIAALITFLVLRSKQKSEKYNSSFRNTSLIQSISPPPGSPGMVYTGDDRSLYLAADPNLNDPNRRQSHNMLQHITGSSAQNPQHTDGHSHYTGRPEL